MGFFSFLGRVLFASVFILPAWQIFNELDDDGGPAAKEWAPKLIPVHNFLTSKLGEEAPNIDGLVKHFVASTVALRGFGGLLFVFGSPMGAGLLMFYLLYTTPILYDFYNYEFGGTEFFSNLQQFLQCVSLFGALLFFMGMKNSILRKQYKKMPIKPKAA